MSRENCGRVAMALQTGGIVAFDSVALARKPKARARGLGHQNGHCMPEWPWRHAPTSRPE